MRPPPGLLCFEGADGSGKTTLADYFVEKFGAVYVHCGVVDDMRRHHADALSQCAHAIRAGRLACLDRHWISEFVYAPIFRSGPAYSDDVAAEFDDAIRDAPGAYVLCVPRDLRQHVERFRRGRETRDEYPDVERFERVVVAYRDLADGNIARPGDSIFDRFVRYSDFASKDDRRVIRYDVDVDGRDLARVARKCLDALAAGVVA